MRRLLCSRFGAMAWKMLYFLCVSGVSFFSFREEPWWPAQIGGLGVEESLWEGKFFTSWQSTGAMVKQENHRVTPCEEKASLSPAACAQGTPCSETRGSASCTSSSPSATNWLRLYTF